MALIDLAEPDVQTAPPARPASRTAAAAHLAPLEWAVVALAERDTLNSLKEPGRIAGALAALFGIPAPTRLADDRLEALRRLAVHAWRRGFAVPIPTIRAFYGAGFTPDQLELVVSSINLGRSKRRQRI